MDSYMLTFIAYPCWFYIPMTIPAQGEVQIRQEQIKNSRSPQNLHELFEKQLIDQLCRLHSKPERKLWTQSQVQKLMKMRNQESLSWLEISKHIADVNPQICKRKYQRTMQERTKWPGELDKRVKYLYEIESKSWRQIFKVIEQQFHIKQKRKKNQIRDRYRLYLRSQISKQNWTMNQDLSFINILLSKGKKWKTISNIYECRTQLQLKNRFYGTLKPIIARVIRKLQISKQNASSISLTNL